MNEPFVNGRCIIFRTNRRALMVALAVVAAGVLCLVATFTSIGPQPFATIGMAMTALGLVGANAIVRFFTWPAQTSGEVRADGRGVQLDGELVLPRERAARGFMRSVAGQSPRVRIVGPHDEILLEIETPNRKAARALLRATDLDTEAVVARFTLTHHVLGKTWMIIGLSWLPMVVGGAVLFGVSTVIEHLGGSDVVTMTASIATLVTLALGALLLYRWSRVQLVIGRDGLHLKSFGRRRYIAHGQIERLRRWPQKENSRSTGATSEGFNLMLRSGETIALRTLAQRLRHGDPQKDFIFREAQAALADHRKTEGTRLSTLDRGGRTAADWVRDLRGIGGGAQAGHRSAAAPLDDLWTMLEDPRTEVEQRAASAVALAASGDANAGQRIRLLSRATANPALQRAFEAAADDDLEQLEEAMAAIDERTESA
ncbi:MAG: hypothetical protein DRI90_00175 [Deltaproteobacteria bacterium]|nr:MAG: hypothetical protein DRI90_00175 [Deltaproteobacteria bacterium]